MKEGKKPQFLILIELVLIISLNFPIRIVKPTIATPPLSGRSGHILVLDTESRQIFLFGGHDGENFLDDTWFYDFTNKIWTRKNPQLKPSARWTHAMAYDSFNKKVILFGGYNESGYLDDTWAYDMATNSWEEMKSESHPSPRHTHTMVYDSDSQKVVLFGGNSWGVQERDMWTYDYQSNHWEQIVPELFPPSKSIQAMSIDSDYRKIIIFGGFGQGGSITDDTWVYDISNNTWEEKNPKFKPGARYGHTMVYDVNNKKTVLFGGSNNNQSMNDVWIYDLPSDNWTELNFITRPEPRYLHSMVYFHESLCAFLFGGMKNDKIYLNDLWAFNTSTNTWIKLQNGIDQNISGINWIPALLAGIIFMTRMKKRKM
ncbi:MAG: Kelch repeat-containing protein [Promethearchaeota archaeon]